MLAGFFGGLGALIGLGEELSLMLPRFVPRFSYDGERGAGKLQLSNHARIASLACSRKGIRDEGLLQECAIGLKAERVAGPLVSCLIRKVFARHAALAVGARGFRPVGIVKHEQDLRRRLVRNVGSCCGRDVLSTFWMSIALAMQQSVWL